MTNSRVCLRTRNMLLTLCVALILPLTGLGSPTAHAQTSSTISLASTLDSGFPRLVREGSDFVFDLTIAPALTAPVTLTYTISGSGSQPATTSDYTVPVPATVMLATGATAGTITIHHVDDGIPENPAIAPEEYTLTISIVSGPATLGTATARANIEDAQNGQITIGFNSLAYTVDESNDVVISMIVTSPALGQPWEIGAVTVPSRMQYHITGPGATATHGPGMNLVYPVDYGNTAGNIADSDGENLSLPLGFSFSDSVRSVNVTIPINNDIVTEADEMFPLVLRTPSGEESDFSTFARLDPAFTMATVTILDDDGPTVTISTPSLFLPEGNASSYSVVLGNSEGGGRPEGPVTVTPRSDNPAVTVSGALTFTSTNFNTPQLVNVVAVDDANGADETVIVSHSVDGYSGATAASVTVMTGDDDTPNVSISSTTISVDEGGAEGNYTVVLTVEPAGDVTITMSVGPPDHDLTLATGNALTFTPTNWSTAQSVGITAARDADTNNDTATISHSVGGYFGVTTAADVTVTVVENNLPGVLITPGTLTVGEGTVTTYTIVLTTDPGGDVTVMPSSNNAAVTVPGALTFSPSSIFINWDIPQTVTVTTREDADGVNENAIISHTVGGYGSVTTARSVTVTVEDDDRGGVTIGTSSLTVNEGATASYTVMLSTEPAGNVTITMSVGPPDHDLTLATGNALTFTPTNWNTAQSVRITAARDADTNNDTATISHSVGGYGSVTTAEAVTVTVVENTAPGVIITPGTLTVGEGTPTTYIIVLATDPGGNVTVMPSSNNADVTVPGALTFTAANWNTAQTVTVSTLEDADGVNENAIISHTVGGYGSVTTARSVTVTVEDDDQGGVTIAPTSLTVNEGAAASYPVVLTTEPAGDVTITMSVGPPDHDLTLATGNALTFTPSNWNTAQSVRITAARDADTNNDTATISHSVGGYVGVTTAAAVTVTVVENTVPDVTIGTSSLTVNEGAAASYPVVLTTEPAGDVTITMSVGPPDHDLTLATGNALTFTPSNWNTAQSVRITAARDADTNNDTATISHSVGGYVGVTTAAAVTVTVVENTVPDVTIGTSSLTVNEGAAASYPVVLTTEPAGDVTITMSVGPPDHDLTLATGNALTFTPSNWNTAQSVRITAARDADTNNDTATISHSVGGYVGVTTAAAVTVTVVENTMPGVIITPGTLTVGEGTMTTYTVLLATEPGGNVTVMLSSDNADVTVAPGALTFNAGDSFGSWFRARRVTVSAAEDADETDDSATISHTVGGYGDVTARDVTVTVDDDDDDMPGVTISSTTLSVDEGDSGIYTVVLSTRPEGPVTVTVNVAPSSHDLTLVPAPGNALTFTIANWNTAQRVMITAGQDTDPDDDTATISHTVGGYGDVTARDVTVTVVDDDIRGVRVSPLDLTINKGTTASYTVVLETEPGGNVTITPMSDDPDLTASVLTFTAANWNIVQNVTLTSAAGDADLRNALITHMASGYDVVFIASVVARIIDAPVVTIGPASLTVGEGATTTYTVVLGTNPRGNVTVTPASDNSDVTVPGGLTFNAANWNTAQTVMVGTRGDTDDTDDTATISHTVAGSGYDGATAADVMVTVEDNAAITVRPTTLAVDEGSSVTYTAVLVAAPGGNVVITPSSNNDAVTVSGVLTFTATNWNMVQTFTVAAADDADGTDETAIISHTVSGYGSVTAESVTVTVDDPGPTGPSVIIAPTTLTVDEGATAIYTAVLATNPSGNAMVTPASDNGDVTVSGVLTFTADNWNMAQTFTVAAAEDADPTDDIATISHAVSGYSGVTTAPAVTVTVDDNEPPVPTVTIRPTTLTVDEGSAVTYTVVLGTDPGGAVTVTPTSDNSDVTVPGGLIFTAANWNTAQTVTVAAADDADGISESATISHAVSGYSGVTTAGAVTVAVVDSDMPAIRVAPTTLMVNENSSVTYTVVLATEPDGDVVVRPNSNNRDVTVPGALTFTTGNWNTVQTVAVTAAMDADETDDNAIIRHSVSGYGGVTAGDVTVTVRESAVAITPTAITMNEGSDTVYTVVLLSDPGSNVTVTPTSDNGDVTVSGVLTFTAANWNTAQTITVAAAEDADANADTATIRHAVGGYGDMTTARAVTVAVVDNDIPAIRFAPAALTVDESSSPTYTVVLATEPAGNVVVTPTSGDRYRITVPGALTFTATNWNTAQVVTLDAVMDPDGDTDTVIITHAVSGYSGVTTGALTVTITDTDTSPVFGTRVGNQRYTLNNPITVLRLPTATGDGNVNHVLTPTPIPDLLPGLTFNMATFTLSGTPTVATMVSLTWTATDRDTDGRNDATSMTFTVEILTVEEAGREGRDGLNRVILPEVARALVDDRVNAITRRIRQAGPDSMDTGRPLTLGGQSTLSGVLTTHGRAFAEGTLNLKTMLGDSDFVLPLNASEMASGFGLSDVTIWGGGDYRSFSGNGNSVDWEGDMFSAHIGADVHLREDLLAGLAVSWSEVDLEYDSTNFLNTNFGTGDYGLDMTSVHPYLGWTAMDGRMDLWITAGYGWGDLEIDGNGADANDPNSGLSDSDVTLKTVGGGGSAKLLEGRAGMLRVKGEILQTNLDVEGSDRIIPVEIEARRLRLGLEASRIHQMSGGRQLVPTLEVGLRNDSGDGRTGTGAEIGGSLRYTNGASGITWESHGRVLVGHSGDYEDWGVGGAVRLEAGHGGQGLSFSLQPAWGATASRVAQVWSQEAGTTVSNASRPRNGRVDLNLGYGLGWDDALVTPYGQMTLTNGQTRAYRLGSRMRMGDQLMLNLEGTRQETDAQPVDHGILLKIGLNF